MERMAGARRHYNAKGTWCPPDPHRHLEGIPFPREVNGKITALEAIFKSTGVLPEQDWKNQKVSFETHTWLWMCGQKISFYFIKATMLQ